jgi:hypothetical protein
MNFTTENSNNKIDLGPPPQMIRTSYDEYEDIQLTCDNSFEDYQNKTPDDFSMPEACENWYNYSCNNLCYEEEMELPPPQPLKRMLTNAHLPPDDPEVVNLPIWAEPVDFAAYYGTLVAFGELDNNAVEKGRAAWLDKINRYINK